MHVKETDPRRAHSCMRTEGRCVDRQWGKRLGAEGVRDRIGTGRHREWEPEGLGGAGQGGYSCGLPRLTRLPRQACLPSRACRPCCRSWLGSVTTFVRRLLPRTSGELSPLQASQGPLPSSSPPSFPRRLSRNWSPGAGLANSSSSSICSFIPPFTRYFIYPPCRL